MGLVDLIKKLFKKEEQKKEVPENEAFMVALVPKKIFDDRSYKDERGLVSRIGGTYFDSCADELAKTTEETLICKPAH